MESPNVSQVEQIILLKEFLFLFWPWKDWFISSMGGQ